MKHVAIPLMSVLCVFAQSSGTSVDACKLTTFGIGFTGDDIQSVISRFANSDVGKPKSEFETTEQYQRRLASIPTETLIFVLPPDDDAESHLPAMFANKTSAAVYDADTSKMSVGLKYGMFDNALHLKHDIKPLPSYMAQNSFGASIEVRKTSVRVFGLTLSKDGMSLAPIVFSMPLETAKDSKPSLRLAIAVQASSMVIHSEDAIRPRVDYPFHYEVEDFFVPATVRYLFAFDSRTGNILQRAGCK